MLTAHHTAVKARVQAHPKLAGKLADNVRHSTGGELVRANYVVLQTVLPGFLDDRLTGEDSPAADSRVLVLARVVAVDYSGLLLLLDALDAQLKGHRLQVAGRACTAFERTLDPAQFDQKADLHYADVEYDATSSRA